MKRRLAAGAALVALLLVAGVVKWSWFPGRAFDPLVWAQGAADPRDVDSWDVRRGAMAERMIARQQLLGMDERGLRAMLGEPMYRNGRDWAYFLGPQRGHLMGIDEEFLHVGFDDAGKVDAVGIR